MAENTRDRILRTLLECQRCTINDLAESVGINPISVRHHVIKLEAQGLVASEEERHGVGRPPKVYYLTEAGLEKFPTRYLRLANRLLDQLKAALPEATVNQLFAQMAKDVVTGYTEHVDLAKMSMEERLDQLSSLLLNEGFTVEWERDGDQFLIHEISCPYYHVGENHPEVCTVDETLIANILLVPTQRINRVLNGDSFCTYVVNQAPNQNAEILT